MPGWRRPLWLPTRFWPESQNVASCDLLDFYLGKSSGSADLPRAELSIHGLKAGAATGLEKSENRGVQAARNGPSLPPCVAKAEMSTADRLLILAKSTASGRVTLRASSDLACFFPEPVQARTAARRWRTSRV